MSVWVCRCGRFGEHEARFIEYSKIYLTFGEINAPLSSYQKNDITNLFTACGKSKNSAQNFAGQANIFYKKMKQGDWVVTPSKVSPGVLHIGEIISDYAFDNNEIDDYRNSRAVNWFADMAKTYLDLDIVASLNTPVTVFGLSQAGQEERFKKTVNTFLSTNNANSCPPPPDLQIYDLEAASLDEISDFIISNFKGEKLEDVVEAVLRAKGFTVYHSPKGKDKGVDLLACSGELGFASPKICVQVKSTEGTVEHAVLQQLIGTMSSVGAEYGLLVSWGGFKNSIISVKADHFFKVRLWDRLDLLNEFLSCYDKIDEEMKEKIPLKRIWVLDKNEGE